MPFEPDPDQKAVLEHTRGPLLVTGPPGSGKTAVLRERVARLIEGGVDPQRIALFTLGRRAARQATDVLLRRLGRSLPDLPVFTVHSFAFRALVSRRFAELDYAEPPRVLAAPEQYAVVREMLLGERQEEWPSFGHLLGVVAFARQVADFVLRCQERLLDPEAADKLVTKADRTEYREVVSFYRRYLDALADASQIDFGGLLFQTVGLLERGLSDEDRFEHVLVDDYQDATPAAEAIVRALAREAESVVIAADPAGHVFSYRGGSLEPLARAKGAFPVLEEVSLRASHRLGSRVVVLAPLENPAVPPAEPMPGFEARCFAHPGEEMDAVAHELMRFRVEEDVAWEEMAIVLRRYGPALTALRNALSRHQVPFLVVAEGSALAGEPAVRPVIDLLRYALRPDGREELIEPLLASTVIGLDPHQLRRLRREARKLDVSLRQLVEQDSPMLPPDLSEPIERFRALLRDIPEMARERGPDGLFFELWRDRLPACAALVSSTEPGAQRDLDALAAFSDSVARFAERRPGAGMEDLLDTIDAVEFGPDPRLAPEDRRPGAVRVLSAHRAQGLEFEVVLVPGCLEGEFPSLSQSYPLVSLDALVTPRTPPERIGDRMAEERALFRLAVSRARRSTVLFASRSMGDRTPRTLSRFAPRLGLVWTSPPEAGSIAGSLRGMETELRRRLADRSLRPAHRLAAAAALARVGAQPAEWWSALDWTDPGEPLYERDIRTSYSRLSTLDNCGLQYLYEVELGLDPRESFQMWVGSTVHGIIERTGRGEIERTEEALLEVLDREWRADLFPNRAVEHRRYLDAKAMLSRWLANEQPDPIHSEVQFEFPLDGAIVRGKIDAIFRMQNGHLRVVDYKTGRSYPTKEDVQEDLQLAAYYLAVKRVPELAELGEPGYLQLAYVGQERVQLGYLRLDVAPAKRPGYEEWAESRIKNLIERVRREDFAPDPEAECRFCAFKTICPRWPQGREAPV